MPTPTNTTNQPTPTTHPTPRWPLTTRSPRRSGHAIPRLYQITIPGLSITAHFPAVRRRLLADFPKVLEVLATTMPCTLLIAYRGEADTDAWLDALDEAVAMRPVPPPNRSSSSSSAA
jgi:hypothetical protein